MCMSASLNSVPLYPISYEPALGSTQGSVIQVSKVPFAPHRAPVCSGRHHPGPSRGCQTLRTPALCWRPCTMGRLQAGTNTFRAKLQCGVSHMSTVKGVNTTIARPCSTCPHGVASTVLQGSKTHQGRAFDGRIGEALGQTAFVCRFSRTINAAGEVAADGAPA